MNPIEQYRPDEWALYMPLHGPRMLELGGKWCSQASVTYKEVFEGMGFEHVSIDWNGEHGAIAADLRKPLWDDFGQFDMVSNMGTTEHVSDQRGVWENIHMMTRVGGVYVGQTPYHDGQSWYWHGDWYPTERFYKVFSDINGWKLERLYKGREKPNENLYCRMVKVEDFSFRMPMGDGLIKKNARRPRSWAPE